MKFTPGRRGCFVSLRTPAWYFECDAVSGELITDAVLSVGALQMYGPDGEAIKQYPIYNFTVLA